MAFPGYGAGSQVSGRSAGDMAADLFSKRGKGGENGEAYIGYKEGDEVQRANIFAKKHILEIGYNEFDPLRDWMFQLYINDLPGKSWVNNVNDDPNMFRRMIELGYGIVTAPSLQKLFQFGVAASGGKAGKSSIQQSLVYRTNSVKLPNRTVYDVETQFMSKKMKLPLGTEQEGTLSVNFTETEDLLILRQFNSWLNIEDSSAILGQYFEGRQNAENAKALTRKNNIYVDAEEGETEFITEAHELYGNLTNSQKMKTDIQLFVYRYNGDDIGYKITYYGCYPTGIGGASFSYDSNNTVSYDVDFEFDYYTIEYISEPEKTTPTNNGRAAIALMTDAFIKHAFVYVSRLLAAPGNKPFNDHERYGLEDPKEKVNQGTGLPYDLQDRNYSKHVVDDFKEPREALPEGATDEQAEDYKLNNSNTISTLLSGTTAKIHGSIKASLDSSSGKYYNFSAAHPLPGLLTGNEAYGLDEDGNQVLIVSAEDMPKQVGPYELTHTDFSFEGTKTYEFSDRIHIENLTEKGQYATTNNLRETGKLEGIKGKRVGMLLEPSIPHLVQNASMDPSSGKEYEFSARLTKEYTNNTLEEILNAARTKVTSLSSNKMVLDDSGKEYNYSNQMCLNTPEEISEILESATTLESTLGSLHGTKDYNFSATIEKDELVERLDEVQTDMMPLTVNKMVLDDSGKEYNYSNQMCLNTVEEMSSIMEKSVPLSVNKMALDNSGKEYNYSNQMCLGTPEEMSDIMEKSVPLSVNKMVLDDSGKEYNYSNQMCLNTPEEMSSILEKSVPLSVNKMVLDDSGKEYNYSNQMCLGTVEEMSDIMEKSKAHTTTEHSFDKGKQYKFSDKFKLEELTGALTIQKEDENGDATGEIETLRGTMLEQPKAHTGQEHSFDKGKQYKYSKNIDIANLTGDVTAPKLDENGDKIEGEEIILGTLLEQSKVHEATEHSFDKGKKYKYSKNIDIANLTGDVTVNAKDENGDVIEGKEIILGTLLEQSKVHEATEHSFDKGKKYKYSKNIDIANLTGDVTAPKLDENGNKIEGEEIILGTLLEQSKVHEATEHSFDKGKQYKYSTQIEPADFKSEVFSHTGQDHSFEGTKPYKYSNQIKIDNLTGEATATKEDENGKLVDIIDVNKAALLEPSVPHTANVDSVDYDIEKNFSSNIDVDNVRSLPTVATNILTDRVIEIAGKKFTIKGSNTELTKPFIREQE
jgi:hypothetical protein